MIRKIINTTDGSSTIFLPEWNESYHSTHGAVQESRHVFIKNGLYYWVSQNQKDTVKILEIGFGTGLNCFMTHLENLTLNLTIHYEGIEAFPVKAQEVLELNYVEKLNAFNHKIDFDQIHQSNWNEKIPISSNFNLLKKLDHIENMININCYDLIYFDAFGARVQPELWTESIFKKMYDAMNVNGILVTYAAKGSVRRAMQSVGFYVERLTGPPGKREMLRAQKL